MKNNLFQIKLMEEIHKRIPKKSQVVQFLMELLGIEKEAVYRRLRGEVPFSFNEVAIISQKLSLSIDNMIDSVSQDVSPFKLKMIEFDNPLESDLTLLGQLASFLDFINNPMTECGHAANIIPQPLYCRYENLTRFYLFKWLYLHNEAIQSVAYKDVLLADRMKEIYRITVSASEKIGDTKYILDFQFLQYLINDLNYFRSINLISADEIELIREDLAEFLDYFEELTLYGKYATTGNSVRFYISSVNFDTGYSYLQTTTYKISFIKAFTLNAVASFDKTTYMRLKHWIHSLIKSSTLITESGEVYRIRFFHEQRRLLDGLRTVK